jgi:hypothetical protein
MALAAAKLSGLCRRGEPQEAAEEEPGGAGAGAWGQWAFFGFGLGASGNGSDASIVFFFFSFGFLMMIFSLAIVQLPRLRTLADFASAVNAASFFHGL